HADVEARAPQGVALARLALEGGQRGAGHARHEEVVARKGRRGLDRRAAGRLPAAQPGVAGTRVEAQRVQRSAEDAVHHVAAARAHLVSAAVDADAEAEADLVARALADLDGDVGDLGPPL